MPTDKPRPGISAHLMAMFERVRPEGMSWRQWCEAARVNTSFFTDLRKGREPGIDKIERLAAAAGFTLAEFLGESERTRAALDPDALIIVLSELFRRPGPGEPDDPLLQARAEALAHVLQLLARNPAIAESPASLRVAAQSAAALFPARNS